MSKLVIAPRPIPRIGMNSWLDFGLYNPPSHGENRGSSP